MNEDIINEQNILIEENKLVKINESIYLTKYQQNILEKYHIPFTKCKNMTELLFLLSDTLEDEELERVAMQIEEFHYYNETHK